MRTTQNRDGLWVFAYGSLIWKPGFDFAHRERARLDGFQRSFCMYSVNYRGTYEEPGLVLALDPAERQACEGIAYRVGAETREDVLAYLRERELVTAAYREHWLPIRLASGDQVEAVTYVIDREHEQYVGDLSEEAQARIIARASGKAGPNVDYLFTTVTHLHHIGCPDPSLDALSARVRGMIGKDG